MSTFTKPDLYSYKVGLQLHDDTPEHQITITAKNSDEAWNLARLHYRLNNNASDFELVHMVLWDETKL